MDALNLLRLQIDWGADEALEDAPVDRLRAPPPPAVAKPAPAPRPAATTPAPRATQAERAIAAAAQAATLDQLRAALTAFDGCALRDTAASLVFLEGDPATGLLLIGDPPGEAEDRAGTPFAGPDGVLLDRMLASIALTRKDLMLTPLIPWRPPGGRLPNPGELAVCAPFLHRLIALTEPRRVILAGALAARALLPAARRRPAATWVPMSVPGLAAPIPAMPMPSPATLPRTPAARREAWAALRALRRTIDADFAEK
ncbi:MAG TPA: uracil-DNA glycosylase [Acetobacteraceae bacterium]